MPIQTESPCAILRVEGIFFDASLNSSVRFLCANRSEAGRRLREGFASWMVSGTQWVSGSQWGSGVRGSNEAIRLLEGMSRDRIEVLAEHFVSQETTKNGRLHPRASLGELLNRLSVEQTHLVLVSDLPSEFVVAVQKILMGRFESMSWLAPRLEYASELATGDWASDPHELRANRILEHASRVGMVRFGVGATMEDLSWLSRVNQPCVYQAERRLWDIAQHEGWGRLLANSSDNSESSHEGRAPFADSNRDGTKHDGIRGK